MRTHCNAEFLRCALLLQRPGQTLISLAKSEVFRGLRYRLIATELPDPPPYCMTSLILTQFFHRKSVSPWTRNTVYREPSLGSRKKLKYYSRNLFNCILKVAREVWQALLEINDASFRDMLKVVIKARGGTQQQTALPIQLKFNYTVHIYSSPYADLLQHSRLSTSTISYKWKFVLAKIQLFAQPKKDQPPPRSFAPSAHVYSQPSEKKIKKKKLYRFTNLYAPPL